MNKIILIKISGPDKPGITSAVTAILSKKSISVLDVGQAVIHNNLALGMLIEIPNTVDIKTLFL